MSFNFYTLHDVYTVEDTHLYKNGEVIAEGEITPSLLLLGHPAIFAIKEDGLEAPRILSTSEVRSILPHHECYGSESNPIRNRYIMTVQTDREIREFHITSISESHGLTILKSFFGKVKLLSSQLIEPKPESSYKERSIC